ncbi:S1 family peptidase [Vibrio cyclitrophicus]|uniref:S1 family peptidase n=1 Tax=Vibrio cyclitrophicus TaxID=47951 RepID=UPI0007EEEB88|nr:serine protease [Vibrio cyclitrophicus]OBT07575.1 hypothetical protein A9265_14285 [Vibrio cyclitrophicus]
MMLENENVARQVIEYVNKNVAFLQPKVGIFLTEGESKNQDAIGCGSGFLIESETSLYLVTAYHVVEMSQGKQCCLQIHNDVIVLDKLRLIGLKQYDVAVARVDELRQKLKSSSYFSTSEIAISTEEVNFMVGYPITKNKLNSYWGRVDRHMLGVTLGVEITENKPVSDVLTPYCFDMPSRSVFDSHLNVNGKAPKLQGMSGGPVLTIDYMDICLNNPPRLLGVIVEKEHKHDVVFVTSMAPVLSLIERWESYSTI